MTHKKLVIDRLKFNYEGLFKASEVYNIISTFFFEKDYIWYEKLNQEMVTPKGKQIRIVLEPWNDISDFYKLTLVVKLNIDDLKEVEVEHNGKTIKTHHGHIRMLIDGFVTSDRKSQWSIDKKPLYWFLSVILEKYFFRNHLAKYENWIRQDADILLDKLKTYLNVYKFNYNL